MREIEKESSMSLFREILGTVRAPTFAAVFVTAGMGLTCVLSGCGNASEGAASASVGDDGKTARTTASVEKKDAADSDKQTAAADGSSDKESDGDDDGDAVAAAAVLSSGRSRVPSPGSHAFSSKSTADRGLSLIHI